MKRTQIVLGCLALLFWGPTKGLKVKSRKGVTQRRFFPPSPFGNILFPRWNSPSEEDEHPLAWTLATHITTSVPRSEESLKVDSFVPRSHEETPQPQGKEQNPVKHMPNIFPNSGLLELDSLLNVSQDVLREFINLANSTSKEYARDFGDGVTSRKDFDVLDQLIDNVQVSSEILKNSTTSLHDFPRELKEFSTQLHGIFEHFYALVPLINDTKAFSGVCDKVVTSAYIIDRCYEELRQISLKISILAEKMTLESQLAHLLVKSHAEEDLEEVFFFGQLQEIFFELNQIQKEIIKLLGKQSRLSQLLNQEIELLRENYGQLRRILNGSRSQINRRITYISNLIGKIDNISVLSLDLLDIKNYHFHNKSRKEFPHLKNKLVFEEKINRSLWDLSSLQIPICANVNHWKCKGNDCSTVPPVKEYDTSLPTYQLDHIKFLPDSPHSPFLNQEETSSLLTTLGSNTKFSRPKEVDQVSLPHLTTNPTISNIPPSKTPLYYSTQFSQYPRMKQETSITPQSNLDEYLYRNLHYLQIDHDMAGDSNFVHDGNTPQFNESTSSLITTDIPLYVGESTQQTSNHSENAYQFNTNSSSDKEIFKPISTTETTPVQIHSSNFSTTMNIISEQSGTQTLTSMKEESFTAPASSVTHSNGIRRTNIIPHLYHKVHNIGLENSNYGSGGSLTSDNGIKRPPPGNLRTSQIRGRGFINSITNDSSAKEIPSFLSTVPSNITTNETTTSSEKGKDGSFPNFKEGSTEVTIDSQIQTGSTSYFNPLYQRSQTTESFILENSSRSEPSSVNTTPWFLSQANYKIELTKYRKNPLNFTVSSSTPSFLLNPNQKEKFARVQFITTPNDHKTTHSSEFLESTTLTPTSSMNSDSVGSKVFIPFFQGTSDTSIRINNTIYKTQMFNLWSNWQPKETTTLSFFTQVKKDNKTRENQQQIMVDIENDYTYKSQIDFEEFESYRKYAKEFSMEDLVNIDVQEVLGLDLSNTPPPIPPLDQWEYPMVSEEEKFPKFDSVSYLTTTSEGGSCDKTEAILGSCKIIIFHQRRPSKTDWNVSLICPCTLPSYEGSCPLRVQKGTQYITNICRVAISD